MKTFAIPLFYTLLLVLSLSACEDDDENDTSSEEGYTVNFIAESRKAMAQNWVLKIAAATVTEIELEDDDGTDTEIDIEGNYSVNLLTGSQNPDIPRVDIASGTYEELEVQLGDDEDENDASLLISADWSEGTTVYPVEIQVYEELEFELENDDGEVILSSNEINELTVVLVLQDALNSMDMSQASIGSDNTIIVDNTNNTLLLSQFLAALEAQLED